MGTACTPARNIRQGYDDKGLTCYVPNRYIRYRYTASRPMHDIVDPRKLRGLQIAAMAKIVKRGVVWMVPSQSGAGRYEVSPDAEQPHCNCPDHETRGVKCKHIIAVEILIERERNADGTT